ncbi:MAG: hydrogenase maturation nickel metallochaperone HypA [Candidatus Acetothermia bacterium]|jgi:hydrogenase nickel incorporation protein HypA/HybF|nr:hydrogenase maturation nickel metallochaperone HypA [Candidatus Acetothermia bacterium]MDH7504607.1 hydrogenase maturation nickel metallochaperone HypA [Candidatus Acetothermia bacterium]
MHEYSVAEELVRAVLAELTARGLQGEDLLEVHLRKGELRLLSDEALRQAYEILAEGTPLAGSKLVLEEVKAEVVCRACGYRGPAAYPDDPAYHFLTPILACPRCRGPVELESGRELELVQLVLATPEEAPQ